MKQLLIFILIFWCSVNILQSQMLTQEEKDKIISDITKVENWGTVLGALNKVKEYKLTEALPTIEDNYMRQMDYIQMVSIKRLQEMKSLKFRSLAHITIDSAESIKKRRSDNVLPSNVLRFEAIYYLVKDKDFSAIHYLFEPPRPVRLINSEYIEILIEIIKNVSLYRDKAKTELVNVIQIDTGSYNLSEGLETLVKSFGAEILPDLVLIFKNQPNGSIRRNALDYLVSLKYPGLNLLLRECIMSKHDLVYNDVFMNLLLTEFGTPSDFQFIVDYKNQKSDENEKILINNLVLFNFIPSVPSTSISVNVLLDSLFSYKEQCYKYNWIGDANFVTELTNGLTNARKHLANQDSINCRKEIEVFQSKVDKEYKDTNTSDNRYVTIEGWKFLYYNAQYIIDRLPSGGK